MLQGGWGGRHTEKRGAGTETLEVINIEATSDRPQLAVIILGSGGVNGDESTKSGDKGGLCRRWRQA